MKLYKWVYARNLLELWFFVHYEEDSFLGWKKENDGSVTFYRHNYPFKSAEMWTDFRVPKYSPNEYGEKKGWKIFLKKEARKAKRKMIKDLFHG